MSVHRWRSIRLKGYDYAQAGAYFITICAQDRECLFGDVVDVAVILSSPGRIIWEAWCELPEHYQHVQLNAFVVMPNHVHGIIMLCCDSVEAGLKPAATIRHALPEVVRAFKTFSSRRINTWRQTPGTPVWQRNYYEHVIRSERDLEKIQEYVATNHLKWALDRENPHKVGHSPLEDVLFDMGASQ
jgi:putative transposase